MLADEGTSARARGVVGGYAGEVEGKIWRMGRRRQAG